MSDDKQTDNQGIQANSVSADVIAVGTGAQASKTVTITQTATADALTALTTLRDEIEQCVDQGTARDVLNEDLNSIQNSIESSSDPERTADLLESFAGKLKMVGVIVNETQSLITPIKAIAGALGLALSFLA